MLFEQYNTVWREEIKLPSPFFLSCDKFQDTRLNVFTLKLPLKLKKNVFLVGKQKMRAENIHVI